MLSTDIPPRNFVSPATASRLSALLQVALLGQGHHRRYAVPSAGALYPYDLALELQIGRRWETLGPVSLPELANILPALASSEATALSLTISYRPAISTAKYGERGLVYGIQDCGHLIASLKLAAFRSGFSCNVSVLPFADAFAGSALPSGSVAVCRLHIEPLAGNDDLTDIPGINADHLDQAIRARRSANTFGPDWLSPTRLAGLFSCAQSLHSHLLGREALWQAHLALRDGPNGWTRTLQTGLGEIPGLGAPNPLPVGLDPVSLFCGQVFAADAGAILILSEQLGNWRSSLAQSLSLGQFGHCLYLAAAMNGVSACCVGGFDYTLAAQSFGLDADRYAAYAMLFGTAGAGAAKVDRSNRKTPRAAFVPFPTRDLDNTHAHPHL